MQKAKSILFLLIFSVYVLTPSVIMYFSDSNDTVWIFSINEEENKDRWEQLSWDKINFWNPGSEESHIFAAAETSEIIPHPQGYQEIASETLSPPPENS